jgi:hypothetical protein
LAFALDRQDDFLSSAPVRGYLPDTGDWESIDNWSSVVRKHGFEDCADDSFETGFQKVALYATSDGVKHAAKQQKNGMWASKLGSGVDIEHQHLDALEGEFYGTPVMFFRIARPDWVGAAEDATENKRAEPEPPPDGTGFMPPRFLRKARKPVRRT